jgi:hypothetical protein
VIPARHGVGGQHAGAVSAEGASPRKSKYTPIARIPLIRLGPIESDMLRPVTSSVAPDSRVARASDRSLVLGFLTAFTVCMLSYLPSIDHSLLHWDDDRIVAGDPFLTHVGWAGLVDFFSQPRNEAYQPLHRLSYWLDVPWFGLAPRALHVTNVLLWSLAAGVWYLVFRRNRLGWAASLVGTFVFALHPSQVEAVVWVTGRKDCLASLFVALSCLAFCREKRGWSALAYGCAALSKTSSLPLPLVFVCCELQRGRPLWPAVRAQLITLASMVALGLLLVSLWSSHELVRPSPLNRALLSAATLGHYVKTALLPAHPAPLYPIWYAPADIPAGVWLGLVALALAFVLVRGDRALRFCVLAFLCMLLPVLNLVPLYFQLADRYLSLPLVALGLGMAVLVERTLAKVQLQGSTTARVTAFVLAAWPVLLLVVNLRYQRAWADDVSLWTEGTRVQPRAFYAWLQLGHAERNAGAFAEAVDAYEHAIETQPTLSLGHTALFYAVTQHEVADPARVKTLVGRYQAGLQRPELLDSLAEELIGLDARNSTALVLQRLFDSGALTPAQKKALLVSSRASGKPWVARAIESALRGDHPASAKLR